MLVEELALLSYVALVEVCSTERTGSTAQGSTSVLRAWERLLGKPFKGPMSRKLLEMTLHTLHWRAKHYKLQKREANRMLVQLTVRLRIKENPFREGTRKKDFQ